MRLRPWQHHHDCSADDQHDPVRRRERLPPVRGIRKGGLGLPDAAGSPFRFAAGSPSRRSRRHRPPGFPPRAAPRRFAPDHPGSNRGRARRAPTRPTRTTSPSRPTRTTRPRTPTRRSRSIRSRRTSPRTRSTGWSPWRRSRGMSPRTTGTGWRNPGSQLWDVRAHRREGNAPDLRPVPHPLIERLHHLASALPERPRGRARAGDRRPIAPSWAPPQRSPSSAGTGGRGEADADGRRGPGISVRSERWMPRTSSEAAETFATASASGT